MRISIHQPNFLPWLGFFNKAACVDTFVFLDHVQYTKNSYQNRCKIKTASGAQWLTVPVLTKGRFGQATSEVEIDNSAQWQDRIWKTVLYAYKKAPFFGEYGETFRSILLRQWDKLVALNETLLFWLFEELEIRPRIVRSSDLNLGGTGSRMILEVCLALEASEYLSGPSGKAYLNIDEFRDCGIRVTFQDFSQLQYPQLHGAFVPGLSVLDALFNLGTRCRNLVRASDGS